VDLATGNSYSGADSVCLNKGPNGGLPWTNLGYGLAGVDGVPSLEGGGTLQPGSAGALALGDAAPNALSLLLISMTIEPTPFKCGTLIPDPNGMKLVVVTGVAGDLVVNWTGFPANLSGLIFDVQGVVVDPSAACGVSLSNALKVTVP